MQYTGIYESPLGKILLVSDNEGLTGLWFVGQRYYAWNIGAEHRQMETAIITAARSWLDQYFSGKKPDIEVPVHFIGSSFQKSVWNILTAIPYGETVTYGQIAEKIAQMRGLPHMSAQAVGGAVGHNPISIIVPCHRVVGTNGSLTGYGGGIERKIRLLEYEHIDTDKFFVPAKL